MSQLQEIGNRSVWLCMRTHLIRDVMMFQELGVSRQALINKKLNDYRKQRWVELFSIQLNDRQPTRADILTEQLTH